MRITDALRSCELRLREAGVPEPRRDSRLLLSFVLGRDAAFIIAHPEATLTNSETEALGELVERRRGREPIQYITGRQEFYGLEFAVTPDVLIPRPETEILVECAIETLRDRSAPHFCEIGVGSGCIAISIIHQVVGSTAVGTDISKPAIDVALRNARSLGVDGRIQLIEADLFDGLGAMTFDLIVSNPPYVPVADFGSLQAEVRDFEPRVALTDGRNGLTIIRRIIDESPEHLRPGAVLILEIGFAQNTAVQAMFDLQVWEKVEFLPDLQSIPRIAFAVIRS